MTTASATGSTNTATTRSNTRRQTAVVDFTNGSIYDFYQEDRYYYNGHVVNIYGDYGIRGAATISKPPPAASTRITVPRRST